jgi:Galactose oxidase, central domain
MVKYFFQENKWGKVTYPPGTPVPKSRSGHSSVIHQGSMWVFGGRDEDNNKLNDLWKFEISTSTWQEIKPADGVYPLERSGHSSDIYEGQYMIVFGGIYEITKELNDLYLFDFTKRKWVTVFEESNSPIKGARDGSTSFINDGNDPLSNTLGGASGTTGSPIQNKKLSLHAASPTKKRQPGVGIIPSGSSLKAKPPIRDSHG